MSETNIESTSVTGQTVFAKGSTGFMKYYDTGSGKWERWSGSGGTPFVTATGGSMGITGSSWLEGDFYITGSAITLPVTGSMDCRQSGSWKIDSNNIVSVVNSSSGSLASGSTFTGSYIDAVQYDQANMLILTDQPGTLYFDHSVDGVTSPPTRVATFGVSSGSSATYYGVTPRAKYFRVRFTCTGSGASNYNLQTTFSDSVKGFTFMPTITPQSDTSLVLATKSILEGRDYSGVYRNVPLDNAGQLRVNAQPYLYATAEGDVPNHTSFVKLGNVSSVVNVEQDIWSKGGKYVFPTVTGSMIVQSTSTADRTGSTGILTLKIGYLNQNYVSKSETLSMNGTTPVPTVNTDIFRVNSIRAVTVGTGNVAAGTIQVSGSTNTNVYRILNLGQTRGRALIHTVPSGSTTYITGINLSSVATAAGHFTVFTMRSNFDDILYNKTAFMEPWFEISLQDQAQHFEFSTPVKIPSTCDVVGSVIAEASNANTVCYGSWRGWTET